MNGGRPDMWRPTGRRREWESFQAKNGTYRSYSNKFICWVWLCIIASISLLLSYQYHTSHFSHNINLGCCTLEKMYQILLYMYYKVPFHCQALRFEFLGIFFPCKSLLQLFSIMDESLILIMFYYFYRVDRKERARLKNVKFTGKTSEKVKDIYIHSIEFQLSSSNLHEITFNSRLFNAYPTTLWILYMLNASV